MNELGDVMRQLVRAVQIERDELAFQRAMKFLCSAVELL
jgi:hypothetical protein